VATAPKLSARSVGEPFVGEPGIDAQAKLAELATLVGKIRDDVRTRHAAPLGAEIALTSLEPLQRARDAAERQAASIGRVNPRNPGLANDAIQAVKGLVARSLNWFVRDQVTFNREVIRSLNATVESLQETNRALRATLVAANTETHAWAQRLRAELGEQRTTVIAAIDHSARGFEAHTAEAARTFEAKTVETALAFEDALARATGEMQQLLWTELAATKRDYEAVIHQELRLTRLRAAIVSVGVSDVVPAIPARGASQPAAPLSIDWLQFAQRFRGSEEYVRRSHEIYVEPFRGHAPVVDLGCGRGEFLELMRVAGTEARGVDASSELVAICRYKGLAAECADAFTYLESAEPGSLGGVFCSQMAEHLTPADVVRLIRLAHRALRSGGLLVIETPNPECLAIFATHFYIDPSHTRPIPPSLMAFHYEETGFVQVRLERLHPAVETMPSLASLSADVREAFFGALDYAASAAKI